MPTAAATLREPTAAYPSVSLIAPVASRGRLRSSSLPVLGRRTSAIGAPSSLDPLRILNGRSISATTWGMAELEGKVAVITGAGSGMGRASTEVFVREGAKVLAADISGRQD